MKDPLRGLAVVAGLGEENVRYVGLWVAVVEREPARLDLHHDAVARQKHMVHVRQCEPVALHLARRNGAGMDQTLAVTSAEDVHADGKLVAAQRRIRGHLLGVHVDELHDPVAVRAAGRGKQIDHWRAANVQRSRQHVGQVSQDVGAIGYRALIRHQPALPGGRVLKVYRPRDVRDGLRGIGHVLIERRGVPGRCAKSEAKTRLEIQVLRRRVTT